MMNDASMQRQEEPQTLFLQAFALHKNGQIDRAIVLYRQALTAAPASAVLHHNLGAALHQSGRYAEALQSFRSALRCDPRMAEAFFNGGNTLRELGRPDEAADWYARAVAMQPEHADAHYNLGNLRKAAGRLQEAESHYRQSLAHRPEFDSAWNNLGSVLLQLDRVDEACDCFRKAGELNPGNIDALYNLGLACRWQGRADIALQHVERVLERIPEHAQALALRVPLLQQNCAWGQLRLALESLEASTRSQLAEGRQPAESPFLSFARSADPRRSLEIARVWSRELSRRMALERQHLGRTPSHCGAHGGRITIGYLSERFRDAATGHLTAGLFERHDRKTFEIIAYSLGKDDGSRYRRRIEQGVDRFIDLRHASTADAVRRMRADGVDILVDLMGWMHGHRMDIAASRPAPVQVNYLGFPGTTGADFFDYILADAIVIPPEQRLFYSEAVVYLPHCYQATDPDPPVSAGPISRADCGLPDNGIVFASFSTDYKIDADVFALWMDILRAVPGSVLWLLVRTHTAQENLRREARASDIDPNRLVFAEPWPKERHLARLGLADAALDTLTVNGHTTVSDALWAGVPVITLQGRHFASRVAASILKAVGMPSLIAHSPEAYRQLAVQLGNEPGFLSAVRGQLAERKASYPLFDIRRLVRHLESAYLTMWQRYTEGHGPQGFAVEDARSSYSYS